MRAALTREGAERSAGRLISGGTRDSVMYVQPQLQLIKI